MARKTVFVSDFSGNEILDAKEAVTVTLRFGDGRKGIVVADAHVHDSVVQEVIRVGHSENKRGRRPRVS